MEISGINNLTSGAIQPNEGSFVPSNSNSGLSQEFVNRATELGQAEIAAGNAPADADPFHVVLNMIATNIPTMFNVTQFDFSTEAE